MIRGLFLLSGLLSALPTFATGGFTPVTGVRHAAAGEFHSCVVLVDGSVECFGLNEHGQLGDGTARHRVTAGAVAALDDAVQIVAGAAHSCALRESGTVMCWGANDAGQLGNGGSADAWAPVAVTGLEDVQSLSAGARHTCAVKEDGTAWCWGANASGQLGDGTTDRRSTPVSVSASLADLARIDAGAGHTCAVTEDGAVFCWGANDQGQLGTGGAATPSATPVAVGALSGGVSDVAAGVSHTCALHGDGGVSCWGSNAEGESGGGAAAPRTTPVVLDGVHDIVAITAGHARSCLLDDDGAAVCIGSIDTTSVALDGIATIDATHEHVCAMLVDGQARCWGGGQRYGEHGTGFASVRLDAVPVRGNTREVEAGTIFACALDTSGFVRCWGGNDFTNIFGQDVYYAPVPQLIPQLAQVDALSASDFHACALIAGDASCWGGMGYGETGHVGWGYPYPTPAHPIPGISPVESIDAGMAHTCAVTQSGAAFCWGEAPTGNGTMNQSQDPVAVAGLQSGVRQVAAGLYHRCALLDDGTVKCWGHLISSPPGIPNPTIGDGSGVSQLSPVTVSGLQGVVSIAAGRVHTCAVLDSGRLHCWGFNGSGQLGDGTTESRFTPVEVPGLENVAEVHAGAANTCVIFEDASAACWGQGSNGQLGNGKRESSLVPVAVTAWTQPLADFALGETFSCAVSTTGELRCWGGNSYTQLGESGLQDSWGRTVQRSPVPYRVFEGGFESD